MSADSRLKVTEQTQCLRCDAPTRYIWCYDCSVAINAAMRKRVAKEESE